LYSVTLTTQYIPKCVVKYLRILFLYSDKYSVTHIFTFPTKSMYTVYKIAQWSTYKTTEEVKKKNAASLLFLLF